MNLKSLLAAAIIFTALHSYGQDGRFIDKDPGIKRFESKIIKFLVDNQAFGGKYSRLKEIEGIIYIKRELKLYRPSLMLISFGSMSAHGWQYWGVMDQNDAFLFHYSSNGKDSHNDLINYLNKYDVKIRQVILNHLQTNAQEDYHGHEIVDEPNK